MSVPPGDMVGGHTPGAYVDRFDVSEQNGILTRFENADPVRGGRGTYTKRRAWIQAQTREGSDPICNMGYLKGINCRIGGNQVVRDVLFALHQPASVLANHYFDAALITYTGSDRYDSSNWAGSWTSLISDAAGASELVKTFWRNGAVRNIWAGMGSIVSSAHGMFRLALGAYLDGPISVLEFIDRKTGVAPFRGYFADPNVGADADGREEYSNWCIHAAKPYTFTDSTYGSIAVTACSPRTPLDNAEHYVPRRSGECFEGWYDFVLTPMDRFLEPGPPLFRTRFFLQDEEQTVPAQIYHYRGRTLVLDIDGIKNIAGTMNPSIELFGLWGKWQNPNPTGNIWTDSYESNYPGYNLDAVPESVGEFRLIALIDTNGNQYEIPASGSFSNQGTAAGTGFVHSDRFNYFDDLSSTNGWINVVTTNGEIVISQGRMYNRQYWEGSTLNSGSGKVYIEIDGYQGVWPVGQWWIGTDTQIIDLSDITGLPAYANITRIRFCHPWIAGSGSNNQRIRVYTSGPKYWSSDYVYPFPDDADIDFETFYPHPTFMAESPSGNRIICGKVRDLNMNADILNRLYATNGQYRAMFTLGLDVKGEITGCAFLDEKTFIATTSERSYIGRYFEIDGSVQIEWLREETPYGHSGWMLNRDGEGNVWGLSSTYGLWVIGPAGAAIRQDLPPVGPQRLAWNESQREYFLKTYADYATATNENRIKYASLSNLGNKATVALPKFTT